MASAPTVAKIVLGNTRQCVALFGRGLSSQSLDQRLRADLENQLGRFKIWAGTIGVFAAGNASADFRLRNDQDIKEVMVQMLIRLRKTVQQLINPTLSEEPIEEDNESNGMTSSTSSSSLALSLDDDSDAASAEQAQTQQDHQPAGSQLMAIESIITRLYRLSAVIKKPISFSENTRVNRFIGKARDGHDMKEYEAHVRLQIQFRRGKTSPTIIDRLVNAVVFRRKKLLYRERHWQKLNQGLDHGFMEEISVPSNPNMKTLPRSNATRVSGQNSPFLKVAATAKSSSATVPFSATEASSVNRRGMASYTGSVAPSGMTRSAIARRDQLDVPQPPQAEDGAAEAVCPYCFEVVDKGDMARARWTRHILKDVDPYVCLFEDCNKPNEHFKSVEDWLSHMKWQHTIKWSCQASQHKAEVFNSQASFESHMRKEHSQDVTEAQLPMLTQQCAQPFSDPFTVLASQNDNADSEPLQLCPLCPFSFEKDQPQSPQDYSLLGANVHSDEIGKTIRNHVAAHLESIALLSLPEQDDLENAASNELQSQSAQQSSRQADQDLPAAVFDDESAERTDLFLEDDWAPVPDQVDKSDVEDGWDHVFAHSRRRIDYPPLGQDPTLKGFVERARRMEIMSLRQISRVPIIVVRDPDGLEIAQAYWVVQPDKSA